MTLKSFLYKALAVSNDINAVRKHRVGKRIARRAMGRQTGRAMGRILR